MAERKTEGESTNQHVESPDRVDQVALCGLLLEDLVTFIAVWPPGFSTFLQQVNSSESFQRLVSIIYSRYCESLLHLIFVDGGFVIFTAPLTDEVLFWFLLELQLFAAGRCLLLVDSRSRRGRVNAHSDSP